MKISNNRNVFALVMVFGFLIAIACRVYSQDNSSSDSTDLSESIRALSATEKKELKSKRERFAGLSMEEKQKLRDLHDQIEQHPEKKRLVATLIRYNEWLKSLPPSQKLKLLEMPKDQRLKEIRKLKPRTDLERFSRLIATSATKEDLAHVLEWAQKYVDRHENELIESIQSRNGRRPIRQRLPNKWSKMFLLGTLIRKGIELPEPSEQELQEFLSGLTDEAKKQFESAASNANRQQLIANWVHAAVVSRWQPPKVKEEDLKRFFNEKLSSEQQDRINRFTGERFKRELLTEYWRHQGRFGGGGFGRRRSHGGPGHPDGRPPRRGPRGDDDERGPPHRIDDERGGRGPRRPEFDLGPFERPSSDHHRSGRSERLKPEENEKKGDSQIKKD